MLNDITVMVGISNTNNDDKFFSYKFYEKDCQDMWQFSVTCTTSYGSNKH